MQLAFLDLTPEFLYGETASGEPSFTTLLSFSRCPILRR